MRRVALTCTVVDQAPFQFLSRQTVPFPVFFIYQEPARCVMLTILSRISGAVALLRPITYAVDFTFRLLPGPIPSTTVKHDSEGSSPEVGFDGQGPTASMLSCCCEGIEGDVKPSSRKARTTFALCEMSSKVYHLRVS